MWFEPEVESQASSEPIDFAEPEPRKPLVLLRNTERALRVRTVESLAPLLPIKAANTLQEASLIADESLDELAEIELEDITDEELKPVRIQMGLAFIGFGGLMVAFLLLYLHTLHPELNTVEQVRAYWYQYVWFVCLGVAGMFMLGREAMRPPIGVDRDFDEDDY